MTQDRELDEDELQELREELKEDNDIPRGWRPTQDTIEAVQGKSDSPGDGEWVDRGIQDVPLNQVDASDSPVKDTNDYRKGVSHDDMVEGFRKLETEVRPAVENGANGDNFSRIDAERGLDYEHGYQKVYDAFYGDSAIKLEKVGDTYNVINGYHRLSVAGELGLETVPAHVNEYKKRY